MSPKSESSGQAHADMMTPSAQLTPGASGLKVAGVTMAIANAARISSGRPSRRCSALRSRRKAKETEWVIVSDVDMPPIFHRLLNFTLPRSRCDQFSIETHKATSLN